MGWRTLIVVFAFGRVWNALPPDTFMARSAEHYRTTVRTCILWTKLTHFAVILRIAVTLGRNTSACTAFKPFLADNVNAVIWINAFSINALTIWAKAWWRQDGRCLRNGLAFSILASLSWVATLNFAAASAVFDSNHIWSLASLTCVSKTLPYSWFVHSAKPWVILQCEKIRAVGKIRMGA